MNNNCGSLFDDPLTTEHDVVRIQRTHLDQESLGAGQDQIIKIHVDIAIPARTASNWVDDVVHESLMVSLSFSKLRYTMFVLTHGRPSWIFSHEFAPVFVTSILIDRLSHNDSLPRT